MDFLGDNNGMTLVGWASDGFPVYARYAYSNPNDTNSSIVAVKPSYKLKDTPDENRPSTLTTLVGGPWSRHFKFKHTNTYGSIYTRL